METSRVALETPSTLTAYNEPNTFQISGRWALCHRKSAHHR